MSLKRNIVFELPGCTILYRRNLFFRKRGNTVYRSCRTIPQQLNVVCHYDNFASLLPILFPSILPKLALDGYLVPLPQILVDRLCLFPEEGDIEKMSLIRPSIALLDSSVYRYCEGTDSYTGIGVFQLSIPG